LRNNVQTAALKSKC